MFQARTGNSTLAVDNLSDSRYPAALKKQT
jgi:hypothetical protein